LARAANEITVLHVVEALEGPIETDECVIRGGPCQWDQVCVVHRVWSSARAALASQLSSASIAMLAEEDRSLAEGRIDIPADSHRRPHPTEDVSATRGRRKPTPSGRPAR
jgi:DNA-binding IscR family transcriptional regulator